jgi:hypothetical protein
MLLLLLLLPDEVPPLAAEEDIAFEEAFAGAGYTRMFFDLYAGRVYSIVSIALPDCTVCCFLE